MADESNGIGSIQLDEAAAQTGPLPNTERKLLVGMVAWKTEHGVELNVLLNYGAFLVQPVVQYYANVGGIGGHAVVAGFRTKVDF